MTVLNGPAQPATFGLVGSGWRSEFFHRLARAMPDLLRITGVVTRSAERGDEVSKAWGLPSVRTSEELLAVEKPDFVVASVPRAQMPETTRDLVDLGVPVLVETPPAPDLAGLRSLWADVGSSGLVQVAEQYLLMPGHAVRLALVREGLIGAPTSVQVSSTHMFHTVSMIRGLLDVRMADVTVNARDFTAPLLDSLDRAGWHSDAVLEPRTTTLAMLDFGDGRHGLYDFTDGQWFNPVRSNRIVVRGTVGEIVDDRLVRLVDPITPVESPFMARRTGIDLNLEGNDLVHISVDGRVVYRNPFVGTRLSEDDIAVAAILRDTGAWARGEGPEPYPLAEGCQDHAIALAIEESARTGTDVRVTGEPWV
jgi:predicted dehydrogenase